MTLSGTFINSLDRKGRLVCPSLFRAALGEPLVLTAGPEGSLRLLPPRPLRLRKRLDPRFTFEVALDATTGRFLIPAALRAWAGLRPFQDIALCGQGDTVAVVPWERCLAALRTLAAPPSHAPALAALYVENASLRGRLEQAEAERDAALLAAAEREEALLARDAARRGG